MKNYFRELARLQDGIENTYKPPTEKRNCVKAMVEKAFKIGRRHLLFVNAKGVPNDVREWHEKRAKINLEIGARLIQYYSNL